MDEEFIGGKPIGFTADNIRIGVSGTEKIFSHDRRLEELEKENEALRKRVDRLYSFLGLR